MSSVKKLKSQRFLKRYILQSDNHPFVGRIFDLSIVGMHFDTSEQLKEHSDAIYALAVNEEMTSLTRRIESLNFVGHLLWPNPMPTDFRNFAISRSDWLSLSADAFLARYISVLDCAILLTNAVFETRIERKRCSLERLRKTSVPEQALSILDELRSEQGLLRDERNERFHHGRERPSTSDDTTFGIAAQFERWGGTLRGEDRFGRSLNIERLFKEGLISFQREFNQASKALVRTLDRLYDELGPEFEARFAPKFKAGKFSASSRTRAKVQVS